MNDVELPRSAPEPVAPHPGDSTAVTRAATVITLVLSVAAMRLARGVLLPVRIAILLTLLLSSPVRWLRRWRIPERLGAGLVLFGMLGIVIGAGALLISPAADWVNAAPATLQKVQQKVRLIAKPLAALQQALERMERAAAPAAEGQVSQVQVASPGILARMSMPTMEAIPAIVSVVFLTYFLLASGSLFRRKLAEFFPGRRDVKNVEHLMCEIQNSTSRCGD